MTVAYETRQQFERVVRNAISVGEYVVATRQLVPGERPFAWLDVSVRGVSLPRVLITNKRALVFASGFRAQSLCFVFGFALEEAVRAAVHRPGMTSRKADVRIQWATHTWWPQELTLGRVPAQMAQEVERFINASPDERERIIHGRMAASPRSPLGAAYGASGSRSFFQGLWVTIGLWIAMIVVPLGPLGWWFELAIGGAVGWWLGRRDRALERRALGGRTEASG